MSKVPQAVQALWVSIILAGSLAGAPDALSQVVVGAGSSVSLGSGVVDYGCADVEVVGTLQLGSAQALGIRDMSVAPSGLLDGETGTISWSGDWSNQGQWLAGTSAAFWADGCGVTFAAMAGDGQRFHTLAMVTATGREVGFTDGQTTEVAAALTAQGAPGQRLRIRSTSPGDAALLDLLMGATQSVSQIDVVDNHAVGQRIGFPGPAANYDSIKGSNSAGWFEIAARIVPVPTTSTLALALAMAALLFIGWRRLRSDDRSVTP